MIWPRKRLKKVPLPWSMIHMDPQRDKLDQIIREKYMKMFPERTFISTKERIGWGEYLSGLGICWEIKNPRKADWDGWEAVEGMNCYTLRPKGLEDHIRLTHYYIPKDLATKMLVLGYLP